MKKTIPVLILTAALLMGAYLGFLRHSVESEKRPLELVIDLNDLKKMAAYENAPLGRVLDEVKKLGITSVGVFEETLPDAGALGELYYAKGSGVLKLKPFPAAFERLKIMPERTYIYAPEENVRRRVYNQLRWALGAPAVKFLSREVIEAAEIEEELRGLGLGISEAQKDYLTGRGFRLVPRVWNDPRYHLGNIEEKIGALKEFGLVIFDGEEILGYPEAVPPLALALKKYNLKYGYVEIVKQDGDQLLRRLMGSEVIRVHSVPKDELEKISREEALDRFARAARERNVRLIYLRPFLPPQIDAYPVEYNLNYFSELTRRLTGAGFIPGRAEPSASLQATGWQIALLSVGVLVGALFLLENFVALPLWLFYLLLTAGGGAVIFLTGQGHLLLLQKTFALAAAIVFPSSAVISTFSRQTSSRALYLILNILAETGIGIFLIVGLLADFRFMSGVETFPAVKPALVLPIIIVGAFFLLRPGEDDLRQRLLKLLNTRISLWLAGAGLVALGALAVLVARSGNFVLPVPGFEKYLRNWLELVLFVRPRTKEFLVGYPCLFLAAGYYLRGGRPAVAGRQWLWLPAAVGVIAPVSVVNSFSHVHTPLTISLIRTFNGLILGIVFGYVLSYIYDKYLSGKATK